MIHHVSSLDELHELSGEGVALVDFYSATCGPCKAFSGILEELEMEAPFLNLIKVNTTDYPEIGEAYDIMAVPAIHFYKDGVLVGEHLGVMQIDELKAVLAQYLYS